METDDLEVSLRRAVDEEPDVSLDIDGVFGRAHRLRQRRLMARSGIAAAIALVAVGTVALRSTGDSSPELRKEVISAVMSGTTQPAFRRTSPEGVAISGDIGTVTYRAICPAAKSGTCTQTSAGIQVTFSSGHRTVILTLADTKAHVVPMEVVNAGNQDGFFWAVVHTGPAVSTARVQLSNGAVDQAVPGQGYVAYASTQKLGELEALDATGTVRYQCAVPATGVRCFLAP